MYPAGSAAGSLVLLQRTNQGGLIAKIERGCFQQAVLNKEYGHPCTSARIVAGSLGIGVRDPFFEYGNPKFKTYAEFCSSPCNKKDQCSNYAGLRVPHVTIGSLDEVVASNQSPMLIGQ